MRIRELTPDTHQAYRKFFLTGLAEDEENFRISPEDEKEGPFPTSGLEDSFTPGAFEQDQLAGGVSFGREGKHRQKLRHKGLLFRLYVHPHFRGKGLAGQLVRALLQRAEKLEGIEQINLTVVAGYPAARKGYEKFCFLCP